MDPVVCSVPYYTMHQILNFFQEFFQRIRAICRFFNSLWVVWRREYVDLASVVDPPWVKRALYIDVTNLSIEVVPKLTSCKFRDAQGPDFYIFYTKMQFCIHKTHNNCAKIRPLLTFAMRMVLHPCSALRLPEFRDSLNELFVTLGWYDAMGKYSHNHSAYKILIGWKICVLISFPDTMLISLCR
jgi:hypothetical protein